MGFVAASGLERALLYLSAAKRCQDTQLEVGTSGLTKITHRKCTPPMYGARITRPF